MIISQKELQSAIKALALLTRGNVWPVLSYARIDTQGITTNNLSEALTIKTKTDLNNDSAFLVHIDHLKNAVKTARKDDLITISPGRIQVGECSVTEFSTDESAEDFPYHREEAANIISELHPDLANQLVRGIVKVAPFRRIEHPSYVLGGINYDKEAGVLVTTSGFALVTEAIGLQDFPSFIVPFSKVYAALPLASGRCTLTDTNGTIAIDTDAYNLTIRKIDGTYPNWAQVVPDYSHCPHVCFRLDADPKQILSVIDTKDEKVGSDALYIFKNDQDGMVTIEGRSTGLQKVVKGFFHGIDSEVDEANRYVTRGKLLATCIKAGFAEFTMSDTQGGDLPVIARTSTGTCVVAAVP